MPEPRVVPEPRALSERDEIALRKRHADHPYCDACLVLAQLDIERAAHKLDLVTAIGALKGRGEPKP